MSIFQTNIESNNNSLFLSSLGGYTYATATTSDSSFANGNYLLAKENGTFQKLTSLTINWLSIPPLLKLSIGNGSQYAIGINYNLYSNALDGDNLDIVLLETDNDIDGSSQLIFSENTSITRNATNDWNNSQFRFASPVLLKSGYAYAIAIKNTSGGTLNFGTDNFFASLTLHLGTS